MTVTDPRSVVQTYTYDVRNRAHTYQDPAGKIATYNYDGLGNITSVVDRKSQTTAMTYDGINRPTLITYQDGSTITITWDGGNRATQFVDSVNGKITRTYDGLNRLTQETSPQGTVSYQYDAAGRRQTMTATGQAVVNYTFDNSNRLTQVAQGTTALGFGYDSAGRRTSVTLPNGIVGTFGFDNANELTGVTYTNGATQVGTLTYGYDSGGRRTSLGGTLAGFVPPAYVPSFTYDGTNRLTSSGGGALSYDANGNLTGFGSTTYTWNTRNQLTATSGGSSTFAYDALGRRASATVGGTTTTYLYDGINPLIIGGTLMMASGNLDEIFAQVGSSGTVSYLHDGTNSTVALTSGSGNVTANDYYSPYGDTATTGSGTTAFQYTGRENDAATGLYYNRARYYSPQLGRFISEDPLQIAAGTNFYAYANGNPTSLTDPLGLFPPSIPGGVANSVTGFGDTVYRLITLGIGDLGVVRNFMGIDGGIDVCSSAYRAGKYAGWAWGVGFVWVGGLAGAPNPVFWAGRAARADALATGNTINDTLIGGVLAGAGVENQLVWRLASVTYAANATGYATVYVGATEASSIWAWEQAVLYARGIAIHGVF